MPAGRITLNKKEEREIELVCVLGILNVKKIRVPLICRPFVPSSLYTGNNIAPRTVSPYHRT
jgi:hypothetical protein